MISIELDQQMQARLAAARALPEHEPQLIERACGDWLALSPRNSPVHIGVTAETEAAAREALAVSLEEWDRLLSAAAARFG